MTLLSVLVYFPTKFIRVENEWIEKKRWKKEGGGGEENEWRKCLVKRKDVNLVVLQEEGEEGEGEGEEARSRIYYLTFHSFFLFPLFNSFCEANWRSNSCQMLHSTPVSYNFVPIYLNHTSPRESLSPKLLFKIQLIHQFTTTYQLFQSLKHIHLIYFAKIIR